MGAYGILEGNTYLEGANKLKSRGIKRPPSLSETINTIVNAYNSGDKSLFHSDLDTCTGIVQDVWAPEGKDPKTHYKRDGKFKIVQVEKNLEDIGNYRAGFGEKFFKKIAGYEGSLLTSQKYYNSLNEREFDFYETSKYKAPRRRGEDYTKRETIMENILWRTAVNNDYLLKAYMDIVFSKENKDENSKNQYYCGCAYVGEFTKRVIFDVHGHMNPYLDSLEICAGRIKTRLDFSCETNFIGTKSIENKNYVKRLENNLEVCHNEENQNSIQVYEPHSEIAKLESRIKELEKSEESIEMIQREIHRNKKGVRGIYTNETVEIREKRARRKR